MKVSLLRKVILVGCRDGVIFKAQTISSFLSCIIAMQLAEEKELNNFNAQTFPCLDIVTVARALYYRM